MSLFMPGNALYLGHIQLQREAAPSLGLSPSCWIAQERDTWPGDNKGLHLSHPVGMVVIGLRKGRAWVQTTVTTFRDKT